MKNITNEIIRPALVQAARTALRKSVAAARGGQIGIAREYREKSYQILDWLADLDQLTKEVK